MQRRSHKNKKYSTELKQQAVMDYLAGKGSQREICKKYEISDTCILRHWILWYNGHKEFKEPSRAKGENYIEFYNTKRYQLKLNCMTPMEYHLAAA